MDHLKQLIREVPDFPKPGILFKDITPVMADPEALREIVDTLSDRVKELESDLIVGIESRGFLFGVPVAYALGLGFSPVRKVIMMIGTSLRRGSFFM